MEYFRLTVKMYRGRRGEYNKFWVSLSAACALFFCVFDYATDSDFMSHFNVVSQQIVDSMNLANVFVMGFAGWVIPLAHWLFFKNRAEDFSILLSVGLSKPVMYLQIFLEHLWMDATAILAGRICGTALSGIFYLGVTRGLGIHPLVFPATFSSYTMGIAILFIICWVGIAGIIVKTAGVSVLSIQNMEKNKGSATTKRLAVCKLLLGMVILAGVDYKMAVGIEDIGAVGFFIGLAILITGIYLQIFGVLDCAKLFFKRKPSQDIYTFKITGVLEKTWKSVIGTVSIVYLLLILFLSLAVTNVFWIEDYGEKTHPFHLVYVNETPDLPKEPQYSVAEMKQMLQRNHIEPVSMDNLTFYRDGASNVFDVNDVNRIFKQNYCVPDGKFIDVIREYMGQVGQKEKANKKDYCVPLMGQGEKRLQWNETKRTMLFGFPCMAWHTMLVSHRDYGIFLKEKTQLLRQELVVINFKTKAQEKVIVQEMNKKLGKEGYLAVYSRWTYHRDSKKNIVFELLFFTAVALLIYAGSLVLYSLKYTLERQKIKEELKTVYDIGMPQSRIILLIKRNVTFFMLAPLVLVLPQTGILALIFSTGHLFLLQTGLGFVLFSTVLLGVQLFVSKKISRILLNFCMPEYDTIDVTEDKKERNSW